MFIALRCGTPRARKSRNIHTVIKWAKRNGVYCSSTKHRKLNVGVHTGLDRNVGLNYLNDDVVVVGLDVPSRSTPSATIYGHAYCTREVSCIVIIITITVSFTCTSTHAYVARRILMMRRYTVRLSYFIPVRGASQGGGTSCSFTT